MSTDTTPRQDAGSTSAPSATAASPRRSILDVATQLSMVAVLVVLVVVAQIASPGFLDLGNIKIVLTNTAPVGLVAIGMTFVLISGGFDLSVAGLFAAAGVLFATFANHVPVGVAFLAIVPIAIAMGLANGLVITWLKVNAFVATLGSSSIFTGLAFLINTTGAVNVDKSSFSYLGTASWWGLPVMVWILVAWFVVGALVLSRSIYGRSVYVVGGNADAARLAGIRVGLVQASTYAITALSAAVAGMLLASQTGVGQANVGANVTLDSIAIVIIGGTSLRGGQGAMWRTLVGFLIIATIDSLFNSLAWNSATQSLAKGAIIIVAVAIDALGQRRR